MGAGLGWEMDAGGGSIADEPELDDPEPDEGFQE
jgi:hypothetical protein